MGLARTVLRVAYPAALLAVIAASLAPTLPKIPLGIDYMDKIEHCLAYVVLGALGASFFEQRGIGGLRGAAVSLAVGMALGIAIEIVQPYVGRSRELLDGLADLVGLLAGGALYLLISSRGRRRRPA